MIPCILNRAHQGICEHMHRRVKKVHCSLTSTWLGVAGFGRFFFSLYFPIVPNFSWTYISCVIIRAVRVHRRGKTHAHRDFAFSVWGDIWHCISMLLCSHPKQLLRASVSPPAQTVLHSLPSLYQVSHLRPALRRDLGPKHTNTSERFSDLLEVTQL